MDIHSNIWSLVYEGLVVCYVGGGVVGDGGTHTQDLEDEFQFSSHLLQFLSCQFESRHASKCCFFLSKK